MIANVIVHENYVRDCAVKSTAAAEVLRVIEERKRTQVCIPLTGLSLELCEDMPPPTDDLELKVIGGSKWRCCTAQLFSLRKAGYRASFDDSACYDGGLTICGLDGLSMPEVMDYVPEFREVMFNSKGELNSIHLTAR